VIVLLHHYCTGTQIPCLSETTLPQLEERFKLLMSKDEAILYAKSLIQEASQSWTTSSYDEYQRLINHILS